VAQDPEAFELLDCAAVLTFRLGLVAQEESPGVALADQAAEAFGEGEVAVLGAGDLQVADQVLGHGNDRVPSGVEGFVQASGEEAGFQAGRSEQGLLSEGDAFDGEKFLGVDGAVDGDQIGFEAGDGFDVFQADDGEVGGGEAMAAGVLRRAGFALGGAGAGGAGGIIAVRGKLPGGDRAFGAGRFGGLFGGRHGRDLSEREIARHGVESGRRWGPAVGRKGFILMEWRRLRGRCRRNDGGGRLRRVNTVEGFTGSMAAERSGQQWWSA
jgi:hypothetical protein